MRLAAGGIVLQQHGGKFIAAQAAPGEARTLIVIGSYGAVVFHEAQGLVRGGAERAGDSAQLVNAPGQLRLGLQRVGGELIKLQGTLKAAAGLAHGRCGHIVPVFGNGGSHQVLLGRVKFIQRLTLAIIDGHRRFISCFFQGHGKLAVPTHLCREYLPLHGHGLHKALGIQQVQALSADLIYRAEAIRRADSHLAPLQCLVVEGVPLIIQQSNLTAGGHQQAAVQIRVAPGAVPVILVEPGAAALVLFRAHVGDAAAQTVKGGAIQQDDDHHHCQHRQNRQQKHPQLSPGQLSLFYAFGGGLLQIAHFKFHLFHSVSHPHTRPV